jgi:fructose-bisphosphate aldolase/2-amino-3,7-dideoxy-D-threo-hept-6-ulosonate synthase
MNAGKKRRLSRIFRKDGRTVIVPMDHGVTLGPVPGLENMQEIVDKLVLGGVDTIVVHKGIVQNIQLHDVGLITHLSASTSLSPTPNWKVQVTSVLQAIRLGVDGVSIHVNVGAEKENVMLADMGVIADECDEYGIPLFAMMYPRGLNIKNSHDSAVVKHVARLGAELGADIIKTNYTGSVDTFKEVVEGCPVPVVIAGGPRVNNEEDVFRMVYDSLQAGGVGVSIGRNVFQHKNPLVMVKAVSSIVHEDATVKEALTILEEA